MMDLLFMSRSKRTILLLSWLMSFLAVACIRSSPPEARTKDYWGCIPPIVKYGYSISATAEPVDPSEELPLVAKGWEPQFTPRQVKELGSIWSPVYYNGSIWMIGGSGFPQIARFDPGKRRLTYYSVRVDEQSEFVPSEELFVSSEKELWGIGNFGYSSYPGILSRYDPMLDRFEPVMDQDGLLIDSLGNISIDDDREGNLWIVLPDNTVARFNPDSSRAEIVLDQKDGYSFSTIAVAPDGKIWLSAEAIRERRSDELWITPELVQYDPVLDRLTSLGVPPGWEVSMSFQPYIDRQGRVWAGGEWLERTADGDYEWFTLTPQPEFVTLRRNPLSEITLSKYRVVSPYPELDASDGSIWFKGGGLLRLELESGEWCRVTEGRPIYEIIEDNEGQLWMTDDYQLYKKRLKP
jgi:streptogramin lyase